MQFIRYIINGLIATAVHFGILSFNLHVIEIETVGLANLIASVFGIGASFIGSRYFVFRPAQGSWLRQAISFASLYALIAILHGAILYVWSDINGLDYRLGFLLATGVQMLISYFGNRTLVFRAT